MDEIAEVKQTVRHENWKRMYSVKTFYYCLKVIREKMLNETDRHDILPVMKCKTLCCGKVMAF